MRKDTSTTANGNRKRGVPGTTVRRVWGTILTSVVLGGLGVALAQPTPTVRGEMHQERCLFLAWLAYAQQPAVLASRQDACTGDPGPTATRGPEASQMEIPAREMHDVKLAANALRLRLERQGSAAPSFAEEMRQVKREAVAFLESHEAVPDLIRASAGGR